MPDPDPTLVVAIRPPADARETRALFALNHAVFAAELGQHATREDGVLEDKFHEKNAYLGAWRDGKAIGMICAHWTPPFSAVQKFGSIMERHVKPGQTAEIRLFALAPEHRGAALAISLGAKLLAWLGRRGMERVIISAIDPQKRFYERVGFYAVGEAVRDGAALFHPMRLDLAEVMARHAAVGARYGEPRNAPD